MARAVDQRRGVSFVGKRGRERISRLAGIGEGLARAALRDRVGRRRAAESAPQPTTEPSRRNSWSSRSTGLSARSDGGRLRLSQRAFCGLGVRRCIRGAHGSGYVPCTAITPPVATALATAVPPPVADALAVAVASPPAAPWPSRCRRLGHRSRLRRMRRSPCRSMLCCGRQRRHPPRRVLPPPKKSSTSPPAPPIALVDDVAFPMPLDAMLRASAAPPTPPVVPPKPGISAAAPAPPVAVALAVATPFRALLR